MKHLKLYESWFWKRSIESICKKYKIENYTINEDGSVDVKGFVHLNDKHLRKLPLKFGRVTGTFYCNYNKLTTLEGSPRWVGGDFTCNNNKLTSFEGAPDYIGGTIDCSSNKIESFEGFPNYVMDLRLYHYNDTIINPVYEVWRLFGLHLSVYVTKIELFNDYDIIRPGKIIILDRLNAFLQDIDYRSNIQGVSKVKGYKCI